MEIFERIFFVLAKNSTNFAISWNENFPEILFHKNGGKKKKKTDRKYIVVIVRIGEAQVDPSVSRLELFSIMDST